MSLSVLLPLNDEYDDMTFETKKNPIKYKIFN